MAIKKKKETKKQKGKIPKFSVIIFYIVIVIVLYKLGYRVIENYCLNNYATTTNAVIIDEKNFNYGNKGVVIQNDYTYSYQFSLNKETYKGDSHNHRCKIGDSVLVEYWSFYPEYNRIKSEE